ncbi:MAG TPA: phosphatase PAP2 family protein [Chitinophagaceae bacterium]|nr:phosphatase PAP2 family protein [Chitinophagaceae bacterium]
MRYSLALVILLLLIVCFFSKTTSFLGANFFHCSLLDQLFACYTYLGDGLFAIALMVVCFAMRKSTLAIKLFLVFILSGIAAQALKKLFHAPRPKAFFAEQFYTHFIEGITHSGFTSFPSGHTATAFAVAAMLSFNCRKHITCMVAFWMAVLVGYSRVYLGQHFVEDVLAGIITGVLSAIFIEYLYNIRSKKIKPTRQSSAIAYEQPAIGV